MLVLTRHIGETITIGDKIQVTILGIKNNRIRIGILAPKNVEIRRAELDSSGEGHADDDTPPARESAAVY